MAKRRTAKQQATARRTSKAEPMSQTVKYVYWLETLPVADDTTMLNIMNQLGAQGYKLLFIFGRDIDEVKAWFAAEYTGDTPPPPIITARVSGQTAASPPQSE
jgi:hypothetical protein